MTLQTLRYLIALFDHGHFGRAAKACNISQPTLSTQLKKLEVKLGVTLFERTNKSVRATPLGGEIVSQARRILTDVDALMSLGERGSRPLVGGFSLGVIPTLGPYMLPWLMPALKTDYPELRLAVNEDLTAHLVDGLLAHRLDTALVALPVSNNRLEAMPLFDEPFWFAEPRSPQADDGKVMKGAELRGRRLLLLTEGHCLRDQALAICGTSAQDFNGDFRATSLETIRQMVALGMGSTLLPAMACDGGAQTSAVIARPLDGLSRRIGLVWRQGFSKVRDIHLLAETIRNHLPASVRRIPTESS
jgi:LysR family hydrogen peroxide-inducible transcriptional activator